ncbi:phosphoglycolate phosphatase [Sporobacter termitidis DSM 10068]|uniref:Phosphoglycolate phosphatase n=1 Tax=Sporobacter termitidis DSM 10068 TaxID=1123282 RepID=A0A1M5Y463_9FIRM|nr:HAD-IA family hydrolase [Sporobacter termitidis]SHI06756.1 phosphoglycolate phosphatase [Sporobacter termitidis DSM 10068]
MDYSVYLFDFDYTLANSERGIVACYRHVLDKHGYTGVSDYDICRTIGHTLVDSFEMLCGEKDRAKLELYRSEYGKKADEIMVDNTFLYPQAVPALEALKARGRTNGIISTKLRSRIMGTLERYNIVPLVDIIIGGEDVTSPKPDPEGVLAAMARLGADKSGVLYIGDSLVDAGTAKNAGVDFAAVLTGTTTAREFDGFPCVRLMKDLGELI